MESVIIGAASHPGQKRKENQDHYDHLLPDDDITLMVIRMK